MMIPRDQHCHGKHYGNVIPILASSHFLNGLRFFINSYTPDQVLRTPHLQFQLHMFEKIMDFIGSIYSLIAFMIAQDYYFFTEISETCTHDDFGLTRDWIQLEITIFYFLIVSTVLFLLMSKFFLKQSGLMYLEKEDSDFLQKYNTMNGFYSTFFITTVATSILLNHLYQEYDSSGDSWDQTTAGI